MVTCGDREKKPVLLNPFHQFMILAFLGGIVFSLVSCGGSSSSPPQPPAPAISPAITSISPASIAAGSDGFTLAVSGSNFNSSSKVRWSGSERTTEYVSSTRLNATINASDISTGGTRTITVRNTSPSTTTSNGISFYINYPSPIIISIYPSSLPAGSSGFTLIIYGRDFVPSSVLYWDNSERPTDYINETRLSADVSAADIENQSTIEVCVLNPSPGGGYSNYLSFEVRTSGLSLLTKILPDAFKAKPYNYVLQAEGGIPPYNWDVHAGSLPAGLNLSADGEIAGTPPTLESDTDFPFTVQISDSSPTVPSVLQENLNIRVRNTDPVRNDICSSASATAISNGILRASLSPYGDLDVYSFQGTEDHQVTIEVFAQRITLYGDPTSQDIFMDSFLELLDDNCDLIQFNDDIDLGVVYDSTISDYVLPYTGTYFIRISDLRGDGRPDFIYELSLSGAD